MQITDINYQSYSPYEQKVNTTASINDSYTIENVETKPMNEQYIKNYNKIIDAISKNDSNVSYPIATAEQSAQFFQEQQKNGLRISPLFQPNANLTDEFSDAYIKTYNDSGENSSTFLALTMGPGLPTVEGINNKNILNSSKSTSDYINGVVTLYENYEKQYSDELHHSVNKNLFQQFFDNYSEALEKKEKENNIILNSYL